jgi:hypothetical protein
LIAIAVSYVLACFAAGLTMAISHVVRTWLQGPIDIPGSQLLADTLFVSGMVAAFVSVYAFTPAVIVIIVAEIFAIRRALFYAICGAIAGPLGFAAYYGHDLLDNPTIFGPQLVMVTAAGIVAGFVYWYFGGRSAGVLERPIA